MSELVFVDTNVLVYARDDKETDKREQARRWLATLAEAGTLRLNLQVINELTRWVLVNERSRPLEELREEMELLQTWGDQSVTTDDVDTAWKVRGEFGYQWFDCLLLGAASRLGCQYFLTEDLTHGARVGNLAIISPFRTPPFVLREH